MSSLITVESVVRQIMDRAEQGGGVIGSETWTATPVLNDPHDEHWWIFAPKGESGWSEVPSAVRWHAVRAMVDGGLYYSEGVAA